MKEIEIFGESNFQLLAVGRNLNQIARRLDEGEYEPVTVERIEELKRIVDAHVKASDSTRANIERGESKLSGFSLSTFDPKLKFSWLISASDKDWLQKSIFYCVMTTSLRLRTRLLEMLGLQYSPARESF